MPGDPGRRDASPEEALERLVARYTPHLSRALTPDRLHHTLGVAGVMRDLVPVYGLDAERALTAALLHDVAKERTPEALLALAAEAGLGFGHETERHPAYLHAPVGAYLARRDLGVADGAVLDAIASHSYVPHGAEGESVLAWCLRFADVLEPSRTLRGDGRLAEAVYAGRLRETQWLAIVWLLELLDHFGLPVHPVVLARRGALARDLQPPGA